MAFQHMILVFSLAVLVTSFGGQALGDIDSCPFNPDECDCSFNSTDPPILNEVTCISKTGSIVQLAAAENASYIVYTFSIAGNVADLPADYFSAFRSIDQLQLTNGLIDEEGETTIVNASQNWHPSTFSNCIVNKLFTFGLDDMIPPSTALENLGRRGLQFLSINFGSKPIKLVDYQFMEFKFLQSLGILEVPIAQISENAFEGLESTLQLLQLSSTSCETVEHRSFNAFTKLKSLTSITLAKTGIVDLPPNAFSAFPSLAAIKLAFDNLLPTIQAGILNSLPLQVSSVALIELGLTEVPKLVFPPQVDGIQLDLSGNEIKTVRASDFLDGVPYASISLFFNPVSVIENGVTFKGHDLNFGYSELPLLDMSLIENVTDAFFGYTANLTRLTLSNSAGNFQCNTLAIYPSLQSIDVQAGFVFTKNRQFKLDATQNKQLDCQQLDWLAPYVLCSKQVLLDKSTCSDGQAALDYFQGLHFTCNSAME